MEKFLWQAFSWYRGKTLGSVFHRPRFPSLGLKCGCSSLWAGRLFKCRKEVKPGPGVHSKKGQIPSSAENVRSPVNPSLGFSWQAGALLNLSPRGSHGIRDPAPSLTGWDESNSQFIWGQRQILFIFVPLKKKSPKRPILGPSVFSALVPVAFPLRDAPDTWSMEVSAFFPCSVCAWTLLVDNLDPWFVRDKLSGRGMWGSYFGQDLSRVCLNRCFCLETFRTITAVCAQWPRSVGKSKQGSVSEGRYAGNSVGLQPSESSSH